MAKSYKKVTPKRPAWQDSTYDKQISYYKKLLADFLAQEIRQKSDLGTYYGTLGTPDQYGYGTYTSYYYMDKNGNYRLRDKPIQKADDPYLHRHKKIYYQNGKKLARPIDVDLGFLYKNGKKVPQKKKLLKKGRAPTEGLYQRELKEQRTKDLSDISSDFGARGLIHSGLFAQKRGDYETEFGKQLAEINRQRSKQYADLSAEHTAFLREQELQKENARLEAIRRRAAKTGSLGF